MKPVILAINGDDHPNSMVGLCPPEGVWRTDGETKSKYVPGKAQRWLWECQEDYVERLRKLKKKMKCELWWVKNGDGSDDNTHSKHGLISLLTNEIVEIGYQVTEPILAIADRIFIVNGTEAHVGRGAALEKSIASRIALEYRAGNHKCKITKGNVAYTKWCWQFRASNVHILCQHRPKSTSRVLRTRGGGANRTAVELALELLNTDRELPDVAYYAHFHHPEDSGENHPIRVFLNPCMKLHGSWESGANFSAERVGIRVAICDSGGFYPEPLEKWTYLPEGDEIWEP